MFVKNCFKILFDMKGYLRKGGQALLFNIPDELVSRKLQAFLYAEFWNVDAHQKVTWIVRSTS